MQQQQQQPKTSSRRLFRLEEDNEQAAMTEGGLCATLRHQNHHDAHLESRSRQGTYSKEKTGVFKFDSSNCKCQSRDSVAAPVTSESHKRAVKVGTASVVLLHVLVVLETLSVSEATCIEITRQPSRPEGVNHFHSLRQNRQPQRNPNNPRSKRVQHTLVHERHIDHTS